jgi:leucyl aminopeptidase
MKTIMTSIATLFLSCSAIAAVPAITMNEKAELKADTLVLLVSPEQLVNPSSAVLQNKAVQHAIKTAGFDAKPAAQLDILAEVAGYNRVLLLGTGDAKQLTAAQSNNLGADIAAWMKKDKASAFTLDTSAVQTALSHADFAAQLAHGVELRSYSFDRYFSKNKMEPAKKLEILVSDKNAASRQFSKLQAVTQGVFLARDLVNQPAAALTPETFAAEAKALEKLGVKVQVLDVPAMEKLQMGAILAVGKGSNRPPRLVIAQWQGSEQKPLAIIGKGITFDSGGYHLKSDADSLVRMTSDMAGAAAALGTIKALALQKAPVHVVALMAMAENMVSDKAMLPGDVLKSASGLTIQVTNTDAEGRLVMADALWYANKTFQPRAMVDIATLTGAKVGAVGTYYAGLFSEQQSLVEQLTVAGEKVNEPLWRLPLGKQFADEVKSDIADLKNTGSSTGASAAAWFLRQFTADTPWAHLDIAGNALSKTDKEVNPKGATGYGVRLLTEWALQQP